MEFSEGHGLSLPQPGSKDHDLSQPFSCLSSYSACHAMSCLLEGLQRERLAARTPPTPAQEQRPSASTHHQLRGLAADSSPGQVPRCPQLWLTPQTQPSKTICSRGPGKAMHGPPTHRETGTNMLLFWSPILGGHLLLSDCRLTLATM